MNNYGKKIICLMLVLIMVVTGCGSTADIHFDKYGNAIITYEYYMTEKEYKANFVDGDLHVYTFDRSEITRNTPYTKATRGGKTYYVYTFHYKEPVGNGYTFLDVRKQGKVATQELALNGCLIDTSWKSLSRKKFVKDVFADLTITFKEPIVSSNGVITNKGYTVSWTRDDMNDCDFLYAYSKSYLQSRVPFSFLLFNNEKNLYTAKDTERLIIYSIIPFKHIYDNNVDILPYGKCTYKDGVYWFKYKYGLGKHNIKAENKVGSVSYNLTVDYTRPKVNIKMNRKQTKATITYSDTGSGIKSATVNGRKIKSGYTITKGGKYTILVQDKAYHKVVYEFFVKD